MVEKLIAKIILENNSAISSQGENMYTPQLNDSVPRYIL